MLVPLVVALAVFQLVPSLPAVEGRDLGAFLETDAGRAVFAGAWVPGIFLAIPIVVLIFRPTGLLGRPEVEKV